MLKRKPIDLIVNADDYGYFPCVSQGILDIARAGRLTATGVLANSPNLTPQLSGLDAIGRLDIGVHLNLTSGRPLTQAMAEKLSQWNGCFPDAYRMSMMVLTGKIGIGVVRAEWQAQIDVCRAGRRDLRFLNSHEHIHMLPVLFKLVLRLAEENRIAHVRLTRAEWLRPFGLSALLRNGLIQCMQSINQKRSGIRSPLFLGLGQSGKLDLDYLAKIFSRLKPGVSYELMCHPGYFEPKQISEPSLLAYHDWEKETALLLSSELQELYENFGIRLSHYQN